MHQKSPEHVTTCEGSFFSELQICHADIWSLPEGLLGVFFMG
jgi:hypothetical protein